jgi:thymidylate synthase
VAEADLIYKSVVEEVLQNGVWDTEEDVRTKYPDESPAHTIASVGLQMKFSGKEVPILTSKFVGWKWAIKEGPFWIWKDKSNVVQDLRDMGVDIWDNWEIHQGKWQGTIGPAYGWQLANKKRKVKLTDEIVDMLCDGYLSNSAEEPVYEEVLLDQVDYLLYSLKTNRASRRHITTLWCVEDLDKMALTPCVYETQWVVQGDKLHLVVGVRSNDMALGNPFNTFQYYVIQRMIAQVTGYEVGTLTFNLAIPHVYDRHVDELKLQLKQKTYDAPTLWINPDVTSFYDFKMEDFKLEGYEWDKKFEYEIAI